MTSPVLRVVSPDATPEEVAAILAAVGAITARSAAAAVDHADDALHEWVHSARLQSRRARLQRGPWRLSGRIGRRARP
ncbi:MAG: acyl-CoA carboxylase epsilon subunit [Acidimicrobiia bacterium]